MKSKSTNPFKMLGIDVESLSGLSDEQIVDGAKAMKNTLAMHYHPDRNKKGHSKMASINLAWEKLNSPEKVIAQRPRAKKKSKNVELLAMARNYRVCNKKLLEYILGFSGCGLDSVLDFGPGAIEICPIRALDVRQYLVKSAENKKVGLREFLPAQTKKLCLDDTQKLSLNGLRMSASRIVGFAPHNAPIPEQYSFAWERERRVLQGENPANLQHGDTDLLRIPLQTCGSMASGGIDGRK